MLGFAGTQPNLYDAQPNLRLSSASYIRSVSHFVVPVMRLKVFRVEKTCLFELTWGDGQQVTAQLDYPELLTYHYQTWQTAYLTFYRSSLRARVNHSGNLPPAAIDYRAQLVQAEAQFLAEFYSWLNSRELIEIRSTIASFRPSNPAQPTDVFLTTEPLELARFPWEAWEIGTEFGKSHQIRFVRTPANLRHEPIQRRRQGRMRILAILGDETGLNFQADREAMRSLSKLADITFIGWQAGQDSTGLKERIATAIADPQGWDILFFAGHSNETAGGELAIAPNTTVLIRELGAKLIEAKKNGLQFALFNSCNGIGIANSLLDLGLSQVAIMREPIHNKVAQEFLLQFVQQLVQTREPNQQSDRFSEYKDVHEALLSACQHLKLERNLTYPSAYLIPSLFRHPHTPSFQLKPFGVGDILRQAMPSWQQVTALAITAGLSFMTPLQDLLLDSRLWGQSVYRQTTQQLPPSKQPPVLLVQIDEESTQGEAGLDARKVYPIDRAYLARLLDRVSQLKPSVIGIDYLLDRPTEEDPKLAESVNQLQKNGSWLIFASIAKPASEVGPIHRIANPQQTMQGYIDFYPWYLEVQPKTTCLQHCPFAYLLALSSLAHQEQQSGTFQLNQPPKIELRRHLITQLNAIAPTQSSAALLLRQPSSHPTATSEVNVPKLWLRPIIDFSIPPDRVYRAITAKQLKQTPTTEVIAQSIVLIAAAGYDQAGLTGQGEDNFPVPRAIAHWRKDDPIQPDVLTGAEAHAYMVHHFLNQHQVTPIPDLWMMGLAAIVGQMTLLVSLYQPKSKQTPSHFSRQIFRNLLLGTGIYGLVGLQVYVAAGILLPWLFPSATLWIYYLPILRRKTRA
ncbi:MAG: CHASE2 domain-containing protein [Synechococcales bacterium]|nr:CHASE2 domain-containing protein [Synechococcales bacterium]